MSLESPSSRSLRLLDLLQSGRTRAGAELAERIGVPPRTLRRDIERLRSLGYAVISTPGPEGGYRLGAGEQLPPLVFTADEAIALSLSLRTAVATSSLAGIGELAVSTFAKLRRVLPARLRPRLEALQHATVVDAPIAPLPVVDPDLLASVALACRDRERLRFTYTAQGGASSTRRVEPAQLLHRQGRWYLQAWDTDRNDWRTFRIDRITDALATGRHFGHREPPADTSFPGQESGPQIEARVRIDAPLEEVEAYLGGYTTGLAADGPEHTLWTIRSTRIEVLAAALPWLPWQFELGDATELKAFLVGFRARLDRAF